MRAEAYIALACRRPWATLAVLVALAAIGGWYGAGIHVRTSVTDLLPPHLESLARLRHVEESLGSTELLEVAVVADDRAAGEKAADALEAELVRWPEIQWAAARRDVGYFLDHRLYYLPKDVLEGLEAKLEARLEWERCAAALAPCLDWDPKAPAPSVAPKDLVPAGKDFERELPASLRFLVEALGLPGTGAGAGAGTGTGTGAGAGAAGGAETGLEDLPRSLPMVTPDGRIHVVLALPLKPAQDLAFTEALLEKLDDAAKRIAPAGVQVLAMGAYPFNLEEYHAVRRDGLLTGVVALALVLGTILAYFRRPRALWVIGVPLVTSAGLTLAVARALVGDLNVITTFVIAILPGLTIDNFGVHLYGRYQRARGLGLGVEAAVQRTWKETRLPLVVATLTSSAALLTLLAFRFAGFSELGLIAGVSLLGAFVATALLFPPLVAAAERVVPWRAKAGAAPADAGAVAEPPPSAATAARRRRVAFACLALGVLLAAGGAWAWTRPFFEYDFSKLQRVRDDTRTRPAAGFQEAMPVSPPGFPVAALGETSADLLRALPALEALVASGTSPFVAVLSVHTFLPADAAAKEAVLARIAALLARAERLGDGDDAAADVERLRVLAAAHPPRAAELPGWVTDLFRTRDGANERLALLYTSVPANDAHAMLALQGDLDALAAAHPGITFASGNTMIGEAVRMVQEDGLRAFIISLAVVFVLVLVTTRSLRSSLLCMVPLVAGVLWLGGAMQLLGIRLGMFNVVVLPMLLGMSIDGAVYLVDEATRAGSLRALLRHTGGDVAVATVTTLLGFVALLLAHHRGLSSIGWLALAGMASVLASTLLFLPLVLYLVPAPRAPAPR